MYELALELGYASPRRMLGEMRRSELGIWTALRRRNPWGEMRADFRIAALAALIANVNRDTSRRARPFTPRDFMPYLERDPRSEELELTEQLVATTGARERRPSDKTERKRRRKEIKRRK